jgi:hypothetical protein
MVDKRATFERTKVSWLKKLSTFLVWKEERKNTLFLDDEHEPIHLRLVWEMVDSSGWKMIEGNFEKF